MIEQLFVKDYILFDSAMIDFSKGMSVITGETGAGKSLLIDAIGYLMGGRIQGNIVRKGKDRCILQMVLSLPDASILKELEENGFFIEDQLIIQRIIQSNQKSSVRINQQATTLSFVKKLCSQLIDVHSQMDTYSLMDPRVQMDLLDQYSNALELRNQVKDAFNAYEDANSLYHKIEGEDLNIDQLDLLTEQCNEIDSLYMTPEEYDSMEQRIEEASHAQRSIDSLYESLRLLNQENGVLDNLYSLSKNLNEDAVLQEKASWIQDIYYTLNEFKDEIEKRKEDLLQGVDQLDELQEKKFKLKKAIRKYGGSLNAMWQRKEELMNQIDAILHREDLLEKLKKDLDAKEQHYLKLANLLSQQRKDHFHALSLALEDHFKDLMLEHARFKVNCTPKPYSANGIDQIEFVVSMNPGQPFSPLKQSASGGELSRLMLALKVVFQTKKYTETLIFDEIDTGVSGKVALKMGEKMRILSKNYQVLCITHLASVAAWAQDHFTVIKTSNENETTTKVVLLDSSQCIDELAVMSSGTLTEASRQAAQDLKKRTEGTFYG